jgi:purine nucleoside phosphorylase
MVEEISYEELKNQYPLDIGIIGRFDDKLIEYGFKYVKIPTNYGLMDRAFYAEINNKKILVIYGRFDEKRGLSSDINYEKTQETFNLLGIKIVIGTFVVGAIQDFYPIGTVLIPHDFIGMGNYQNSLYKNLNFKNVDMYKPFCESLRGSIIRAEQDCSFNINTQGIYVCFHGYPRIETKAELDFYRALNWDIVGQTLDPEATLARESGCCYAAIVVTIDDPITRSRFLSGDAKARLLIQNSIPTGRLKTTEILFNSLNYIDRKRNCTCGHKFHGEKSHFYYLPNFYAN